MNKDSYAYIAILLAIWLLPAYSDALIEEKSSIVGTLCGASTNPLPGVTIRLLDSFFLAEVAETITDADGRFTISNVLPGLYLVSVESPSLDGILKRVQVVSGAPTFVDLRSVLTDEQLKEHDAWDRFKWTMRVTERNPLRDEKILAEDSEKYHYDSDGFLAFLRALRESNNIKGEVSYVNVGVRPSDENWNHQMTQFMVQGDLENEGTWSINGNFLDGRRVNYIASGDFEYRLNNHSIGATVAANDLVFARYPSLDRQLIRRFSQAPGEEDLAENKLWIASVDLKDAWQPFQRLRFDYGARIDYYGYLQDTITSSPHIGASYQVSPSVVLQGRFYGNQSAPGNYYLQPEDVHPYIHDVAFIPYLDDDLHPEKTVKYEAGVDFLTENSQVSVYYYDEEVLDKIATVDLSDSPVTKQLESFHPFVIFNTEDLQSRGAAVRIRQEISSLLSAVGSYTMALSVPIYIIEKNTFPGRQLYFRNGTTSEDFHDVAAGIQASFQQTQTEVKADWRWTSGTPLIFGTEENGSLTSIDLEVHQGIPVSVFSQSELKVLVAIRNLLDQNPAASANADFQRALVYSMPRVIAGGLLLKF